MSSSTLKGLSVLITRSFEQSKTLVEKLTQAQAQSRLLPVMTIQPTLNDSSLCRALAIYDKAAFFIFTSVHAVNYAKRAIEREQKMWPPLQPVFAIGAATRERLNAEGCQHVLIPEGRFCSENLIDKIEAQTVVGQNVVIFGGANPRPFLGDTLSLRGLNVLHAACYQREALQFNWSLDEQYALLSGIDVILCASQAGFESLRQNIDVITQTQLMQKTFLVTSLRLKETLLKAGCTKSPIVADNFTDTSIMSALTLWYEEQKHG
ncbi:MAG: uroporphyrinogen-III synthase [Gammaproteobacteria bacterium]|nr:uroporphyrinogen-III synthase [Gammaproteobacteria bacterium]